MPRATKPPNNLSDLAQKLFNGRKRRFNASHLSGNSLKLSHAKCFSDLKNMDDKNNSGLIFAIDLVTRLKSLMETSQNLSRFFNKNYPVRRPVFRMEQRNYPWEIGDNKTDKKVFHG